jgi:hypothetical protein
MSITETPATETASVGRPTGRPRRRRVGAALLAGLLTIAGALVWWGGREPDPVFSAEDARTAAAGPASVTVSPQTLDRVIVATIMPASGTEARWLQGLDRYLQQVRQDDTLRCTRARRIPAPARPGPSFTRFPFLPDLERIGRQGFDVLMNPGTPAAGTVTPAVAQAQQACQKAASGLTRSVQDTRDPLLSGWFDKVVGLREGPGSPPEVAAARAAIGPCLTARGIRVKDEVGLFRHVDTEVGDARSPAEMRRREQAAGRAYAACAAPLEALLTPRRQALREQFLHDHQDEVRAVRDRLSKALAELAQTQPARLVFPVP